MMKRSTALASKTICTVQFRIADRLGMCSGLTTQAMLPAPDVGDDLTGSAQSGKHGLVSRRVFSEILSR